MRVDPTLDEVDAQLVRALRAFEGPPTPRRTPVGQRRRHPSTRMLAVSALLAGALGILVPAAFAVAHFLRETPHQFIADAAQPANARQVISSYLDRHVPSAPDIASVEGVVQTSTPDGRYGLYALASESGKQGMALVKTSASAVAALSWGDATSSCPPGWALQSGLSFVEHPGGTPLYIAGRASPDVASVSITGTAGGGVVSSGYFLAWIDPSPSMGASKGTSVVGQIVAHSSSGAALGELQVRGDGDVPANPTQPAQAVACG